MTSSYRRDHEPFPTNDEFERLALTGRVAITAQVMAFDVLYPTPVSSENERRALRRAFARYLIDSGKASTEGLL